MTAAPMTPPLPEPSRTRRGRPARFHRDGIVDAAVDAIAERGVDALSMRSIADRLDTTPATLYRHIGSQEELVAEAVDRIVARIQVPPDPLDAEISDWLIEAASAYRTVLLTHPGTADLLLLRGPTGEHGLRMMGRVCAVLARLGLSPAEVAWAYDWLMTTVTTYTAKEDRLTRLGGAGSVADALQALGAVGDDEALMAVLAQFTGDMRAAFERTTLLIVEMLVGGHAPRSPA